MPVRSPMLIVAAMALTLPSGIAAPPDVRLHKNRVEQPTVLHTQRLDSHAFHSSGRQFESRKDKDGKTLVAFVNGTKAK